MQPRGPLPYNRSALPKRSTITSSVSEGMIKVINEDFHNKSEVTESDFSDELAPEVSFADKFMAIFKDSRLELSLDTYVQMLLGSGLKIKIKNKKTEDKIRQWLSDIDFETKLEDGLYSYVGVGNLMFEIGPSHSDYIEIDITTMESVIRKKNGKIKHYKQHVNNKDIPFKPSEVVHLKLTNVRREVWGRGIFEAILNRYTDPESGEQFQAPLILMKQMEEDMGRIFKSYASPMMMFHFEDAGENFIKNQADALKKAKAGAKIVTDKAFKWETLETNPNAKYDKYVEHIQRDIIEPGTQFPLQFFNAGFTARAASESTDSVLIRKIKRIQKRLGNQIKKEMIMPYLEAIGKKTKAEDIDAVFEFESKAELTVPDVITAFRDNVLRRSEIRKYLTKSTSIDIDQSDMKDEPPITSVTPTNKPLDEPEQLPNRGEIEVEKLQKVMEQFSVKWDKELERDDKRKNKKYDNEEVRNEKKLAILERIFKRLE